MTQEVWAEGEAYEAFIGRWSRPVARRFVDSLALPPGLRWLDVGCGTGALTAAVLERADPEQVTGLDTSDGFLRAARGLVGDERATFVPGDAEDLPVADGCVDVVVCGLALNFVPDPVRATAGFARVLGPGGVAAAYVWDYGVGMGMLRHFWDAAVTLDPAASELDERTRFPLSRPGALQDLWSGAGLTDVSVEAVEIPTVFADLADYWVPFLGGQGPAPGYVTSLSPRRRTALHDLLADTLPVATDGTIPLTARAWAVRGVAGPDRS
jgi:SAM-dependent methyltransferase